LAKAVQLALDDNSMRRRAAEAGKAVRAEDGLTRAAEIIERAAADTRRPHVHVASLKKEGF